MPQFLRVHEWQVEEAPERGVDLPVVAALDCAVGCHEGGRIGPVDLPRAPEHVARQLVEDEDDCQRTVGGKLPFVEIAAGSRLVGRHETVPAGLVEAFVLGEPPIRSRLAPEGDDLIRGGQAIHGQTPLSVANARRPPVPRLGYDGTTLRWRARAGRERRPVCARRRHDSHFSVGGRLASAALIATSGPAKAQCCAGEGLRP
jgi:hypothetical protein